MSTKKTVIHNALWMLLGQGGNFLLQGLYAVLLARLLGASEYGIFAAALALVNIIAPYTSLGSNMLFMRYVTADRSHAQIYWGNMLAITAATSAVIAGAVSIAGPLITHINNWPMFLMLAVSLCFFNQVTNGASSVFQTMEKMRWSSAFSLVANLIRCLILVAVALTIGHLTAFQWCEAVVFATAVTAIFPYIMVQREIGSPIVQLGLLKSKLWEGIGFSFAGTTQSVYNDADKLMLAHFHMIRENGFYTLAYRIVDFASAPVVALDGAVLPRYFTLGHKDLKETFRFAAKPAATAVFLGLLAAFVLKFTARWVPFVVGHDYAQAVIALQWLCWLPPLRGIHQLTGGILTGTGRQNTRTATQLTVAVLNIGLNIWWIPTYGWIGACWSSVACDGLLAVLNLALVTWTWQRLAKES